MNKKEATLLSRELRKNQTAAEEVIWEIVRNRGFSNLKFSRQFPIEYSTGSFFIVDFYCHQLKLILEIDGEIHKFQKAYDTGRDNILKEMGFKILRFDNLKVLNKRQEVIEQLKEEIKTLL